MRRPYRNKIIYCAIILITLVVLLHPDMRGYRNYDHIDTANILHHLHEEIAENFTSSAVVDCYYNDIINDQTTLSPSLVDEDFIEGHGIRDGGEYAPQDCRPKFSTAIIVPYRDRAEQLRGFLVYMHTFFRHQRIHYRIFIIEQVDSQLFNRAKLMNIGAIAAIKAGYPCLILHDVDLLPLNQANLYACTKLPRHMSSSIDKFRLEANNLGICRFSPAISRYHMLKHESQRKGENRKNLLNVAKKRMTVDGLSSLHYIEVSTVLHPLFTHIMVDL